MPVRFLYPIMEMEDAVLYNMLLDYKKNEQNVMGENFFLDVFIAFFLDFSPEN